MSNDSTATGSCVKLLGFSGDKNEDLLNLFNIDSLEIQVIFHLRKTVIYNQRYNVSNKRARL